MRSRRWISASLKKPKEDTPLWAKQFSRFGTAALACVAGPSSHTPLLNAGNEVRESRNNRERKPSWLRPRKSLAPPSSASAERAEELKAKGYKAAGFDVDLADYDAVKEWVAKCAELMGGIDVVINNASHPGMAPFGEMTPDIWEYGIKNELDLIYNVCNCAWPYLQESGKNGGASIIITSSTVGLQGSNSPQACHAAAKGACLSLARQLAAEGGPFGIRCNSITPGLVWTEAMANIPKEMATGLIAAQTTQQAVDPIDIAYGYLFLASDEARQITAANLPIDGGCAGAVTGGMQGEIE